MSRFRKLLGMIFIFGVVFFIICDEKGYKIGFEDNQIIFEKIEKKSDLSETQFNPNAVYKNSDLIHINYEFENPKALRKSDGMDPKYLAKLEKVKKKKLEQERIEKKNEEEKKKKEEKVYTGPNIVAIKDNDSISSMFQGLENTKQNIGTTKQEVKQNTGTTKEEIKQNTGTTKEETKQNTGTTKQETKQNTGTTKQETKQNTGTTKQETKQSTGTTKQEIKQSTGTTKQETKQNTGTSKQETKQNTGTISKDEPKKPVVYYPVEKYEHNRITLNLNKGVEIPKIKIDKYPGRESLSLNLYNGKVPEPKILYKNSNKIKIYSGFENPRNMRTSAGLDENFLAKQENSKPTIISLKDNETISSAWQNNQDPINHIQDANNIEESNQNIDSNTEENIEREDVSVNIPEEKELEKNEEENGAITQVDETPVDEIMYKVDKYEYTSRENNLKKGKEPEIVLVKIDKYEHTNHFLDLKKSAEVQNVPIEDEIQENYITIDRPELSRHSINISEGKLPEVVLYKIVKYQPNRHDLSLRKGKVIKHDFIVENTENIESTENTLSDPMLESLLENEEIDINTLESENDEFLQKVFEQTKDRDVMNLIVETYLNEYQFAKAKKFIEELSDEYRKQLKPSLNLRVAFNSFSLSSKTIGESLNSILQDYISKNEISTEDQNRYLGVIALINRNYDRFFEISAGFTSEKNKAFASKLQGYKDQIAKQMGMPEYYFDTLVSLELFNQGLFQPAKVLALYSLQQNSNYILPHQVLAYANFLTNSRDTSVEYMKKLVDLDPNNAEKYRFLIGVAFYRDEKYEQSVVMLSMIKDEKLRLDTQRYLINNYLKLDQKNKLISSWNKLLGSENLVASDFYTYFYETFFHPYSNGEEFELYAYDTELANKMLRVCSITLENEEKAVCTYGTIGRNIAMGQFDGLEQYLLDLVAEYPQGYLYQALGDYYIQQGDLEKAKVYLIKAISLTQNKSERSQIKKLLQDTM